MSFSPSFQNICFLPPCLYSHHHCSVQLSRVLRRLLPGERAGISLAAICLPRWPCCPDPSLGTASERIGPPQTISPIQAPALCSCHIGRGQPLHSRKGNGFQRLFCEAYTSILQMSVLLIHSEFPGAAQALLFPSRKPSQTVPSFWGEWFCLEGWREGEARGEAGGREGEGKKRREKQGEGWEDSVTPMTHLIISPDAGRSGAGCRARQTWVQISAPAFPGCVTLGKLLYVSELHHVNGAITVSTSQSCYACK